MTLPLTSPFTNLTFTNKTQLDVLVAAINALPFGYVDDDNGSVTGTPALTSTGTYVPSAGIFVTFTVPTGGRRYRIFAAATISGASATLGRYFIRAAYNTGSSIGTPVLPDPVFSQPNNQATYPFSLSTEVTVFLTAGTYTAYAAVERGAGGNASDALNTAAVAVYDTGPA